jgi:hypothetical protein
MASTTRRSTKAAPKVSTPKLPDLPTGYNAAVKSDGGKSDYILLGRSLYNGRETLNVRQWYISPEGEWRPGRGGGLCIPASAREEFVSLVAAVSEAWDNLPLIETGKAREADATGMPATFRAF